MSLSFVFILGSTRAGSQGPNVAKAASKYLQSKGHQVNIVDPAVNRELATVDRPFQHYKEPENPPEIFTKVHKLVKDSSLVVLITPEYNHAPSPAILATIDNFYRETWGGKKVAIISYGGQAQGGARAIYTLKNTLLEVSASPLPQPSGSYSIPAVWSVFSETGEFKEPEKQKAFETYLDGLVQAVNTH